MKILHKGILALLFVVLQSALVTIALDVGGTNIGAVPFLLYSNFVGVIVMFFVMYWQDRCNEFFSLFRKPGRLIAIFVIGILISVVAEVLLVIGTVQTNASISGIVYRMYPLIIVVLTPLFLRHRITAKQLIGLLFGFASAYVILSNGTIVSLNVSEIFALLMLVCSAIVTAVTTLLIKKYNIGAAVFMEVSALAAVAFFTPAAIFLHTPIPTSLSTGTLLSILFIGAVDFGIGGALFYYSYKLFNTTMAGIASLATPFLTVILAFILIGTQVQPYYFIATILLATGMIIQGKDLVSAPEYITKQR